MHVCQRCGLIALIFILSQPAFAVSHGPSWDSLTPQQKTVLAPVAHDWKGFSERARKRLIAVANKYPSLKPEEKSRVSARLKSWTALSREQRDKARENYRKIHQLPPEKQVAVKQTLRHAGQHKKHGANPATPTTAPASSTLATQAPLATPAPAPHASPESNRP